MNKEWVVMCPLFFNLYTMEVITPSIVTKSIILRDSIIDNIHFHVDNADIAEVAITIAVAELSKQIKMLVQLDERLCDAVVKLSENPAIEKIKWQEQMWHKTIFQQVEELRGIKEYLETNK